MNNMDNKFSKFLKDYPKIENNITHIIPSYGSYTIDQKGLKKFYKHVEKELFKRGKNYTILEKLGETCPLVIDLDFKYKDSFTERQYTQETINELIKLFFSKLDELFDLEDNQYQVWIFEKPNIREIENPKNSKKSKKSKKSKNSENTYLSKDGIHLVFPNIKSPKHIYQHLIELIYQDETLFIEIMKKTSISIPDNIKDIVDKSIYGTNWMVYGSCKDADTTKYALTNILTLKPDGIIKSYSIDSYLENPLTIIENNSVYNTVKNVTYTAYTDAYTEKYLKNKNLNNNIMDIIED